MTEQKHAIPRFAEAKAGLSVVRRGDPSRHLHGCDGRRSANELYVSPQIEALLGFTQEQWLEILSFGIGNSTRKISERWHLEFARTCTTAERFRSVYRFISRDGRVVWVHGEAKVVRDKDGRPLFLQGVAFDITGRKNAEEELKLLNQTLGQRVAKRTVELDRSNKDLERFGDFVCHELKKPVGGLFDALEGPIDRLPAKESRQRLPTSLTSPTI